MVTSNLIFVIPKLCVQASLRWHYPNQVLGRRSYLPLSLYYKLPFVLNLAVFYHVSNLISIFFEKFYQKKTELSRMSSKLFCFGGGGEESRTPVRKHIHTGISERSHLLKIPSAARQVTAQAVLVASFVMHGAKLIRVTFTTV